MLYKNIFSREKKRLEQITFFVDLEDTVKCIAPFSKEIKDWEESSECINRLTENHKPLSPIV